ncbi:MAG: GNAT family N-acetyltransferase [Bdellovibrionales bacterium]
MKLYRHYKNKNYKYIGVAKHSETLEDVVIYECLYENPTACLWVRPKELFFGTIDTDETPTPRFSQIPLKIISTSDVAAARIDEILPIMEHVFGSQDPEEVHSRLVSHSKPFLVWAEVEGKIVAFKLGYEEDRGSFYSWLGAVLPEYRGLGIASALMTHQHEWCRAQGYTTVRTKTQNRFREMLLLNLKFGFEIIGTHSCANDGPKIILEKRIL